MDPLKELRERQDVQAAEERGPGRVAVVDDTGAGFTGTYAEVREWLDLGLSEED